MNVVVYQINGRRFEFNNVICIVKVKDDSHFINIWFKKESYNNYTTFNMHNIAQIKIRMEVENEHKEG